MVLRPPRSTRTDTLFPSTTVFRSEPRQDQRRTLDARRLVLIHIGQVRIVHVEALAVRLALEQPPGDHARERLLAPALAAHHFGCLRQPEIDRKSTRLNSSH